MKISDDLHKNSKTVTKLSHNPNKFQIVNIKIREDRFKKNKKRAENIRHSTNLNDKKVHQILQIMVRNLLLLKIKVKIMRKKRKKINLEVIAKGVQEVKIERVTKKAQPSTNTRRRVEKADKGRAETNKEKIVAPKTGIFTRKT